MCSSRCQTFWSYLLASQNENSAIWTVSCRLLLVSVSSYHVIISNADIRLTIVTIFLLDMTLTFPNLDVLGQTLLICSFPFLRFVQPKTSATKLQNHHYLIRLLSGQPSRLLSGSLELLLDRQMQEGLRTWNGLRSQKGRHENLNRSYRNEIVSL